MKYITSLLLLFTFSFSFSQSSIYTSEINKQVWEPFIKGFSERNDSLFQSVHSKDIVRVNQDDLNLMTFEEYFKPVSKEIKLKRTQWKTNIELRFTQRIANQNTAFEVGYYKTSSFNILTEESRVNFGKFHVLLKKENGTWKIVMDADTNEDATEEIFLKAQSMLTY